SSSSPPSGSRSHDVLLRRRGPGAQGPAARAAGEGDRARDAAVRPLDADGLPLRAAARDGPRRGARAPLGRARLHRAARPDTRLRARARAGIDGRPRPRTVRPERDLARQGARGARLPRARRARRAARLLGVLLPGRRPHRRRRRARGHRHLHRGDADRRDGGCEPGARAGPAAPLPAAGDPGRRRRRRRERGRRRALPCVPRALRRGLRPARLGRLRVRRVGNVGLRFVVVKTISLPVLAGAATALMAAAISLIFFYAPTDPDQGLSQRIFYFHVPIALTAYACFAWGAWKALLHLWKRPAGADLESYVAIHQGVIFGALTLLTGSLWAKISWGVWWAWSDNQLVLFLVLFLFYCAYFMLRYSVDPGPARANMCAVYALFGVVLIPVSFLAIRLSRSFIHPVVFTSHGPQMTGTQFLTFC